MIPTYLSGQRPILSAAHLGLLTGLAHAYCTNFHPNKVLCSCSSYSLSSQRGFWSMKMLMSYGHCPMPIHILFFRLWLCWLCKWSLINMFMQSLKMLACLDEIQFTNVVSSSSSVVYLIHERTSQEKLVSVFNLRGFIKSSCFHHHLPCGFFAGSTVPVSEPGDLLDGRSHLGHRGQPRLCHHCCLHHPGIPGHCSYFYCIVMSIPFHCLALSRCKALFDKICTS